MSNVNKKFEKMLRILEIFLMVLFNTKEKYVLMLSFKRCPFYLRIRRFQGILKNELRIINHH